MNENNPATDPNNEMEGAYASNPALRPDANETNSTGTSATGSSYGNSDSTGDTAQTTGTSANEGQQVSVERENPVTDPVNEVEGAYASNPALQPAENERRDGETEEQRLNRLREERQRDVPELDSDRGNF
jgi:hypothetical protein